MNPLKSGDFNQVIIFKNQFFRGVFTIEIFQKSRFYRVKVHFFGQEKIEIFPKNYNFLPVSLSNFSDYKWLET